MKKSTRKLVSSKLELRTETIRALGTLDLARAVGGGVLSELGVDCQNQLAAESGNINCPAPARVTGTACG